ncbi:SHOCT domain-containing protein [Methanosphaera sp.]|uniref:SHOCT domain-containing protein n=1 Tax=Methanosphaera sp. TaxID=2666342 RepID=UPI002E77443D|nr:SHOCT domain-containing protein [Methanosphaera sp.]MEE1117900.1 SHOCT domain-containing protein [Methanosphaera sp.]MEE3418472.1 SHOCT domain-containing protein [Methanosphaera sp.]
MGFFNKIEIDAKLRKAIDEGLAIGVAKVDKTGKSSIELLHKDMLIKSYKTGNTLKISVDDIDFVSYSKGNFLEGDKIHIGISGNQLTITGNTDNEIELRNFYNNLIKVRNDEKMGFNYIDDNENAITNTESSKNISSILEKRISSQNSNELKHNDIKKTENKQINNKFDPTEEIRKYYNLMKDGIISEEEFEEKKNELLKYKYY